MLNYYFKLYWVPNGLQMYIKTKSWISRRGFLLFQSFKKTLKIGAVAWIEGFKTTLDKKTVSFAMVKKQYVLL